MWSIACGCDSSWYTSTISARSIEAGSSSVVRIAPSIGLTLVSLADFIRFSSSSIIAGWMSVA